MEKFIITFFIIVMLLLTNCGDVSVNIDENMYEPKIVFDAYIIPGQPIDNIRIMRNYGLGMDIDVSQLFLYEADVTLTDIGSQKSVTLEFLPNMAFGYTGNDFQIESNKSYQLDVTAIIEGETISATSTTKVPDATGFRIDDEASSLEALEYRQKDNEGNLMHPKIIFDQSPTTESYVTSIVALDASENTFIEDNAYGFSKEDLSEDNNLNMLANQYVWNQVQSGNGHRGEVRVEWYSIWFAGNYRAILYAADKNYTDYILTHNAIQEIDGNLLEPEFHIEGDGIGVFGSFIPDTVYFEILK